MILTHWATNQQKNSNKDSEKNAQVTLTYTTEDYIHHIHIQQISQSPPEVLPLQEQT